MTSLFNPIITPELLIKLLKEDLRSSKLLFGLNQLEIVAEPYNSDLGSIILVLMGIPDDDDEFYAFYEKQMERLTSMETAAFHQQLDSLAQELYLLLLNTRS